MVGYVKRDWVDTNDGLREHRTGGAVDPAWRRRGIGSALLRDSERRSAMLAAEQPTDRPLVLGCFTDDRNVGARALAQREGYEPVRWFFDMQRPGRGRRAARDPAAAGRDRGAPGRRVAVPRHLARRHRGLPRPLGRWRRVRGGASSATSTHPTSIRRCGSWPGRATRSSPASINTIYAHENAALGLKRGWLDSVFTRRAWRKRGLGLGARSRAASTCWPSAAIEVAALGVDADNPSGALRLYESFGFAVTERGTAWRKPLEEVPDVIEIALPDAPAVAGLRFRHYRGEEDLPAMLRVYTAVHEPRRARGGHDARPAQAQLRDARELRSGARHGPGRGRRRGGGLRPRLLERARRGRPLLRELRLRPSGLAPSRDRWRAAPAQRGPAARDRRRAPRRRSPKWLGSEGVDADPGNTALLLGDGYTRPASSTTWWRHRSTGSSSRRCPTGSSCGR